MVVRTKTCAASVATVDKSTRELVAVVGHELQGEVVVVVEAGQVGVAVLAEALQGMHQRGKKEEEAKGRT